LNGARRVKINGACGMEKQKRIIGKGRFKLLDDLRTGGKPIKLQVLGKDYERLTTITDVRSKDDNPCFYIDPPKNFEEAVGDLDLCKIKFEFASANGFRYEFITSGVRILANAISVNFPKSISTILRRKDFRLILPQGSKIYFKIDDIRLEMNVLNLSMGGVFAEYERPKDNKKKSMHFEPGTVLKHITLMSQLEGREIEVHVNQALIIRAHNKSRPEYYSFGLQFTSMSKEDLKSLRELIYDVQREFLRKRSRTILDIMTN
jgi:c-di-GMP-binding flagellar brake protein YcgR